MTLMKKFKSICAIIVKCLHSYLSNTVLPPIIGVTFKQVGFCLQDIVLTVTETVVSLCGFHTSNTGNNYITEARINLFE